jgi:hypothetical protein
MADRVFAEALKLLLSAGWRGVVAALLLVVAVGLLKAGGVELGRLLRAIKVEPQALDPERDPDLPPAVAVDGEGNPVDMGRRDVDLARDATDSG